MDLRGNYSFQQPVTCNDDNGNPAVNETDASETGKHSIFSI